jgi:hypothetical protein
MGTTWREIVSLGTRLGSFKAKNGEYLPPIDEVSFPDSWTENDRKACYHKAEEIWLLKISDKA